MARNKVKLGWITNDSSRRTTFKKRKIGILKKTSELGILCGSDTCIILYSPYSPQPDIYPKNVDEVTRILSRLSILPEIEKCKKMTNLESYLRETINKINGQTRKLEGQIRDIRLNILFHECLRGRDISDLKNEDILKDLIWLAENKLRESGERIQKLRSQNPPPAPPPGAGVVPHDQQMMPSFLALLNQQGHHPYHHGIHFNHPPHGNFKESSSSTSFIPQPQLPPSTSTIPHHLPPTFGGNDNESDEDNDVFEVMGIVENLADDSCPGDSSGGGGEEEEEDLLVYPPHMLSAPEDLGHAYVHRPKQKDP